MDTRKKKTATSRPKTTSRRELDFNLVQRALCGEQAAYTAIYNQYYQLVKTTVKRILMDSSLIEDVCMEVFEKAFANLSGFQPSYPLGVWLARIGRNRALDYYRQHQRRPMIRLDEGFNDSESDAASSPLGGRLQTLDDTPEEHAQRVADREYLNGLLVTLDGTQRIPVRMYWVDELSYGEIGEMLGCNRRQARRMVKNGTRQLKECARRTARKDVELRSK